MANPVQSRVDGGWEGLKTGLSSIQPLIEFFPESKEYQPPNSVVSTVTKTIGESVKGIFGENGLLGIKGRKLSPVAETGILNPFDWGRRISATVVRAAGALDDGIDLTAQGAGTAAYRATEVPEALADTVHPFLGEWGVRKPRTLIRNFITTPALKIAKFGKNLFTKVPTGIFQAATGLIFGNYSQYLNKKPGDTPVEKA